MRIADGDEPNAQVRLLRALTLYTVSDQRAGLNPLNEAAMRAFSDEINLGLFEAV